MSIYYVHISDCGKVYFNSVCFYRTCNACCKVNQHIFICGEGMVWIQVQFARFSPAEYVFWELTAREEAMYPCSSTSRWDKSLLALVEAMGLHMERGFGIHLSENERYNLLWR